MGKILQFTRRNNVFDPETTTAMGEAYDRAIANLHINTESEFVVRRLVAKRIIKMARSGELDRDQLYLSAISGLAR